MVTSLPFSGGARSCSRRVKGSGSDRSSMVLLELTATASSSTAAAAGCMLHGAALLAVHTPTHALPGCLHGPGRPVAVHPPYPFNFVRLLCAMSSWASATRRIRSARDCKSVAPNQRDRC